jgi:hypothetical protein
VIEGKNESNGNQMNIEKNVENLEIGNVQT